MATRFCNLREPLLLRIASETKSSLFSNPILLHIAYYRKWNHTPKWWCLCREAIITTSTQTALQVIACMQFFSRYACKRCRVSFYYVITLLTVDIIMTSLIECLWCFFFQSEGKSPSSQSPQTPALRTAAATPVRVVSHRHVQQNTAWTCMPLCVCIYIRGVKLKSGNMFKHRRIFVISKTTSSIIKHFKRSTLPLFSDFSDVRCIL